VGDDRVVVDDAELGDGAHHRDGAPHEARAAAAQERRGGDDEGPDAQRDQLAPRGWTTGVSQWVHDPSPGVRSGTAARCRRTPRTDARAAAAVQQSERRE
jgi:hypothetical protein